MEATDRDVLLDPRAGDRWVVVVAHPDDETFGCGSLIAYASDRGAHVTVVCATRGERGERTDGIPADADLGAVREGELRAAAAELGAAEVVLLDYGDSGLDGDPPPGSLCDAPVDDVTEVVLAVVRPIEPDVVVLLDGSDGHRDHLHVRAAGHRVADALGSTGRRPVVAELALPNSLMRRWLDEMRTKDAHAPYLAMDPATFGTPDERITDSIDASDLCDRRETAIALHRSQRSPFDDLSPELRRELLAHVHLIRV